MAKVYSKCPVLRRPFVVTAHVRNPVGELVAEVPTCCPLGAEEDDPGCRVGIHHRRKRQTGPRVVFVAGCRTHGLAFSLYPSTLARKLPRLLTRR